MPAQVAWRAFTWAPIDARRYDSLTAGHNEDMQITALAGGVGGARFLRGLISWLEETEPAHDRSEVTIIGNTGDDITLHGLRVCPDLDTLAYTLGGGIDEHRGWGRSAETYSALAELAELGSEPDWFTLGDRDLATHIARSKWLSQGHSLSQVTARIADRWGLPSLGVRLLPATDDPIETHVSVENADGGQEAIHFQQWWIKERAALPAEGFPVAGLDRATPAPGVLEAIRTSDVILLPPSNPVVSIGIILGIPGVRDALRGSRAPVVGVSPIVGNKPVKGYADACLAPLGVEVSASGVAGLYRDFLDGWLIDSGDEPPEGKAVADPRVRVRSRDLLMRDDATAAQIAGAALDLALDLGRS